MTYDTLISTMPLSELVKVSGRPDLDPIVKRGLLYSSSNIVGLGIHGQPPETLQSKNWIYFPESNCPFYRVTVFSNYAEANVPMPGSTWSLMCEVSESSYRAGQSGIAYRQCGRWRARYRIDEGRPTNPVSMVLPGSLWIPSTRTASRRCVGPGYSQNLSGLASIRAGALVYGNTK